MTPPEVSQTVFGVPRSHLHCTFENFRWPSTDVQAAVFEFVRAVKHGEPKHLLMTGRHGTGKTHLAVALYRWAVTIWGTMQCALVQVPEFFTEVKSTFDAPQYADRDRRSPALEPFADIVDARRFLVLDDLLGRKPTPWEIDHIIFRLINTAYNNQASLVVTTNYTLDEIAQGILPPHEVSRLLAGAVHMEFEGQDLRVKPV